MSTNVAQQLAEFSADLSYSDVPADVLNYTKSIVLKTIAGIAAGSVHPSGVKVASLIKKKRLPGDVSIVRSGFKTSLWEAIFLNSFYAHVQELEDDRIGGGVSWDITVVSILLALAEQYQLSGKDFLTAVVVGLEAHTRTCLFSAEHRGLTVVPGAVGPAVGAAKALGLGAHETAMAMGLALSSANLSLVNFGTDTHFFESSIHSVQAVAAAEMASLGMTSNPDIVRYLSKLLGEDQVRAEDFVRDLGKNWLLTEIMIKKYPCCFMVHRQIDSLLKIKRDQNLTYDDIARITVHATPGDQLCDRPNPKTVGELQFSFQHTLGTALLNDDLTLADFDQGTTTQSRLVDARAKINVVIDPEGSKFVMVDPSRITVTTTSGREFSDERMYPIGSKNDPLSTSGMRAVYGKFVNGLYPEGDVNRIADLVLQIEQQRTIEPLVEMLGKEHSHALAA